MGVEYALVCDKTKQAYELGRGPWWNWKELVPLTRESVNKFVEEWVGDWDEVTLKGGRHVRREPSKKTKEHNLAYGKQISEEIWSFIEQHPGCRVIDDCGDVFWSSSKENLQAAAQDGFTDFQEIGSRYRSSPSSASCGSLEAHRNTVCNRPWCSFTKAGL